MIHFLQSFTNVANEAHEIALNKGWWDEHRDFANFIANLHGEVSEAWDAHAHSVGTSDKIPAFNAITEELADVIIRIMDYSTKYDIPVGEAILAKMEYNKTRSYRHGGKKA